MLGQPSAHRRMRLASIPDEPLLGMERRHEQAGFSLASRLRVVSPEDRAARPPWLTPSGRAWVAFAGRIDDRETLRAALELRDHAIGIPDGELVARAIDQWDVDAPAHFLGDYAIAAWFPTERRLVLVGDPMGNRTVYYSRLGDDVFFSTSLRGMLAMPEVPRRLDETFLADFLAVNFTDTESTFYAAVRKVTAGCSVSISPAGIRKSTFHRFDPDRRIHFKRDEDYVDAALELIDRAVADRMRSVGPVPIIGSGGLDSAIIAAAAVRHSAHVPFLTAIPCPELTTVRTRKTTYVDESIRVEALAKAFPALQPELIPASKAFTEDPDVILAAAGGAIPARVPGQIGWFETVRNRASQLGATSYLTGGVGNHTLTWPGNRYILHLIRQGRWLEATRELTGGGVNPGQLARNVYGHIVKPLMPLSFRPASYARFSALKASAIEEFRIVERMRACGNDPQWFFSRDDRQLRIHLLHRNRANRPESLNLLRGLHGPEYLAPIGDLRVVEFSLAIPLDQFRRHGESRWLGRRMLRKAGAPSLITDSRSRGYQNPEWFARLTASRSSYLSQIESLRRSATASRLLDIDRLERLATDWPKNAQEAHRMATQLRIALGGGLNVGSFIAWAEGTNA